MDPEDKYSQSISLHLAVNKYQYSVVRSLLESGADVNAIDSKGRTPLHLACQLYRPNYVSQMIEILIKKFQADIEARDQYGNTPLLSMFNYHNDNPGYLYHCYIEHVKVCLDMLVSNGANILATNIIGDNVLHLVIKTMRLHRCCVYLPYNSTDDTKFAKFVNDILQYNSAFLNAKNNKGETPIQLAFSVASVDVVKVLLNHNADISLIKINHGPKGFFYYPKIVPNFDIVSNILTIVDLIVEEGYQLRHKDNSIIMKFLCHEVDSCDCFFNDCNDNLYIILETMLEHGTVGHTLQFFRTFRSIDITCQRELWSYLNIMKKCNFYLHKDLEEIMTELSRSQNITEFVLSENYKTAIAQLKSDVKLKNGMILYNLMSKHPHTVCRFLTKDNVDFELIKKLSKDNRFQNIIEGYITKAIIRSYIVISVYDLVHLTSLSLLPNPCIEEIFSYLTNVDMFYLYSALLLQESSDVLVQ